MLKTINLLIALCSMATAAHAVAAGAKPPRTLQDLECSVLEQRLNHGLVLRVRFVSSAITPTRLPPEPHVALYRDPEAKLQMGITVRADSFRVQEVVVPANGTAITEYRVTAGLLEALRCNDGQPMAAALIFRDQSGPTASEQRCVLRGFSENLIPMNTECPGGTPLTAEGKRQ